jgi:Tol biopolymer transport system component
MRWGMLILLVVTALAGLLAGCGSSQREAQDGSQGRIAFTRRIVANYDIYVIDGEGAHEIRLTHTPRLSEGFPLWSPDGQKIAFLSDILMPDETRLYVMDADGTNKTPLAAGVTWPPSWSPDGGKIAFTTQDQSNQSVMNDADNLSVINADGTHKVNLITVSFAGSSEDRTGFYGSPVWSPTGNKIAFASQTFEEGYDASSSASASAPTPVDEG